MVELRRRFRIWKASATLRSGRRCRISLWNCADEFINAIKDLVRVNADGAVDLVYGVIIGVVLGFGQSKNVRRSWGKTGGAIGEGGKYVELETCGAKVGSAEGGGG